MYADFWGPIESNYFNVGINWFGYFLGHSWKTDWVILLLFGWLFKACGNDFLAHIAHIIGLFLKKCHFSSENILGHFIDTGRLLTLAFAYVILGSIPNKLGGSSFGSFCGYSLLVTLLT